MDIRLSNTVLNRRRIDRIYADAVMRNLSMGDSDIIATYEDYPEPVRQLLFIGDRESDAKETWLDYPTQFALTGDHADALIRMACDQALHAEEHGSPAVWSPVHAWRALGQLRIAAAIVPMLSLLKIGEDDDFVDAEFPIVLGMIGPAAIEPIEQFLNDPEVEIFAACSALSALEEIANRHDTSRQVCIGVLVRLLERHPTSNVILNGFVVAKLINLKAIDAIDTIRGAFARGAVDISIPGDMEDVEIDLGLRTCRETPRPRYDIFAGDPWLREADDVEDEDGIDEPVTRAVKVGRNEPYPCGSGKKYKKCCLP